MSKKPVFDERVLTIHTDSNIREIIFVAYEEDGKRVVKIGGAHADDPEADDIEHVKFFGGAVSVKRLRAFLNGKLDVISLNTTGVAPEITLVNYQEDGHTLLKIGPTLIEETVEKDIEHVKFFGGLIDPDNLKALIKNMR